MGFSGADRLMKNGVLFGGGVLGPGDERVNLLVAALALAGACLVLFEAAVSRLSLTSERYARGPRLAIAVVMLGTTAVGAWRWLATREPDDFLAISAATALLGFAAALGFAADQDRVQDRAGGREARDPRLLRSGAVSGLRYVAALVALPTALWFALSLRAGGEHAAAIVAVPSYVLIYISAALLLCRGHRFERMAAPDVVRGVAALLVIFCGILPAALAEMAHSGSLWLALPSPFMGTSVLTGALTGDKARGAAALAALALALTAATDRLLVARARRAAGR
jgi:hypothetical protein